MRTILACKHREPGMLGGENDGQDGEWQNEDEQTEAAYRMNDARLAKSGLKKDQGRAGMRTKAESEAHNREVQGIPKCDTCRGRHRCHPCPNSLAQDFNFNAREAEMKNITCNYKVSKNFDTIRCQGRGHVANMHEVIVNEQLKRGAKTDPKRSMPKGVTSARGPRQPSAGTRPKAKTASRAKPAARRPGAPAAARTGKPKSSPRRTTGRPSGGKGTSRRREPVRAAGEETDGEDANDNEVGDGEDQEQTEDEAQVEENERRD